MAFARRTAAPSHAPTNQRSKSPGRRVIPTKPNIPPENLLDYCIMIYGQKGSGKSSLAAALAEKYDGLTIMLEPRRTNLKIRQIPQRGEPALTWEDIKDIGDQLIDAGHKQPLIVDTVDKAYELCMDYICRKHNIDHPHDKNDYGKTWVELREEFAQTWSKLLFADIPVIFISHAKERGDEYFDENTVDTFIAPTCAPQAWQVVKSICDYAFYLGYHRKQRMLVVRGNDRVWAASGVDDHFLDSKTKEPYHSFLLGDKSGKDSAQRLLAAYDNKLRGLEIEEEERRQSEAEAAKGAFKRKR